MDFSSTENIIGFVIFIALLVGIVFVRGGTPKGIFHFAWRFFVKAPFLLLLLAFILILIFGKGG